MYTKTLLLIIAILPLTQSLFAQTGSQDPSALILQKDSLFWKAYNNCDTAAFAPFFSTDLEFYHDKGGLTVGAEKFIAVSSKNLCGNSNFRLRREAVPGSVQVFPLRNANGIYGAIISGEHLFYINEQGKAEYLDGQARFTHVWMLANGDWKMARILSYDHRPPTTSNRSAIKLPDAALRQWTGTYKGPKSGTVVVKKGTEGLLLKVQNNTFTLYPETTTRFFMKERDLVFDFVNGAEHVVFKMLVHEGGQLVEEAMFVSKN
jgi:hypothetical protein